MNLKKQTGVSLLGGLAIALAAFSFNTTARANVYATDIQINSTLTGAVSVAGGSSVSLTYHLNDNATAGVTIKVLSGATVVSTASIASPNAGTLMGLNTVPLTVPNAPGSYSVSITAGSTGYPTWQQITPLNANYVAVYPLGLDVDKNTTSPYYGRVVVSCAIQGSANSVSQNCGFYKYNADGTPADEGTFGYANYTTNDGGNIQTGQMPWLPYPGYGQWYNPSVVKIGEDDRIYWQDNSFGGKIVACDILATTNQVIMPDSGYANSIAFLSGNLNNNGWGWVQFDVINVGTASTYSGANGIYTGGQAALILSDFGDYPAEGSWMWHMVGTPGSMVADPTDTYGQEVVDVGGAGDTLPLRTDGIMLDYNLDVFVGEDRNNAGDPAPRAAAWTKWNGGVLPPGDQGGAQGGGQAYPLTGGEQWTEGGGSSAPNDADVTYAVINSRTNPTLMARGHGGGNGLGIDLLVPLNPTITITGVSLNGTTLTINCTSSNPYAPIATDLSLVNSATANGTYAPVAATFTGGNGVFQATTTISGPTGFYKVACPPLGGTTVNGSAVTITGSGSVTSNLASIDSAGYYYFSVAFDNVGNMYGGNSGDNYWRVWSPPGANTNTTPAVVTLTTF